MWIISGNTYPVKEELKMAGCFWSSKDKCWVAPDRDTMYLANDIIDRNDNKSFSSYRLKTKDHGISDWLKGGKNKCRRKRLKT